jgi:hypothetical protein
LPSPGPQTSLGAGRPDGEGRSPSLRPQTSIGTGRDAAEGRLQARAPSPRGRPATVRQPPSAGHRPSRLRKLAVVPPRRGRSSGSDPPRAANAAETENRGVTRLRRRSSASRSVEPSRRGAAGAWRSIGAPGRENCGYRGRTEVAASANAPARHDAPSSGASASLTDLHNVTNPARPSRFVAARMPGMHIAPNLTRRFGFVTDCRSTASVSAPGTAIRTVIVAHTGRIARPRGFRHRPERACRGGHVMTAERGLRHTAGPRDRRWHEILATHPSHPTAAARPAFESRRFLAPQRSRPSGTPVAGREPARNQEPKTRRS